MLSSLSAFAVAPAGYARTEPNQATACSHSTYAPSFNRLARCLRCQSGLQEAPTSGLADGQRDSKRVVCSKRLADLHLLLSFVLGTYKTVCKCIRDVVLGCKFSADWHVLVCSSCHLDL